MWWKITLKSRTSEYIYWISDALDKKGSEIKTAYQFYTHWTASTSFPIGRVQPAWLLKFLFSKQYILIGLFTFFTATSWTLRCALCSSFDLFSAAAPRSSCHLGWDLNNSCLKNNCWTKGCLSPTTLSTFQCSLLKWQTWQLNGNDSSWSDYFLPSNLLFIISLHIKEEGGNNPPECLSLCFLGRRSVHTVPPTGISGMGQTGGNPAKPPARSHVCVPPGS